MRHTWVERHRDCTVARDRAVILCDRRGKRRTISFPKTAAGPSRPCAQEVHLPPVLAAVPSVPALLGPTVRPRRRWTGNMEKIPVPVHIGDEFIREAVEAAIAQTLQPAAVERAYPGRFTVTADGVAFRTREHVAGAGLLGDGWRVPAPRTGTSRARLLRLRRGVAATGRQRPVRDLPG